MGAIGKHIQSEINLSYASLNVNIFLVDPFLQGAISHLYQGITIALLTSLISIKSIHKIMHMMLTIFIL